MKMNRAFVLMLGVSILLAIQAVLMKYAYVRGVGWGTSVVWTTFFEVGIVALLMAMPVNLAATAVTLKGMRDIVVPLVGMVLLSWVGTLGSYYALYLIPASVAGGIAKVQPVFVLIFAFLFAKRWPHLFKESLDNGSLFKKIGLFIATIVGVYLIAGF